MNPLPSLLPTLEALYQLGSRICSEIESFRPDIVLGLAHSGWMPVTVAQLLWAETRTTGFPPAVRTNIGNEKHAIYKARFKPPMPAYCCGECCDRDPGRLGHYLAWIAEQQSWQDALCLQIQSITGQVPDRILVVDDLFGGYRTCYVTLGLLEALYPQAQARMIAGRKDLTNDFVDAWMLEFVPALRSEIAKDAKPKNRARYAHIWHERLKPLITGSEDITPESLDWRLLGSDSPAVQALAGFAASETMLAAPSWASSMARRYAIGRLHGEIPPPKETDSLGASPSPGGHLEIQLIERLFCIAWLNNGITRADIARVFGGQTGELTGGLQQVRRFAQPHSRGKGVVYMPEEATESWITAYDTAKSPVVRSSKLQVSGFAELIPSQLWAGAYPFYDFETQVGMLKDLLTHGVRVMVDLTTPSEFHARWPYQEALALACQDAGAIVERIHIPLRFRSVPTRSKIISLLNVIRSRLETHQVVYLHAGHNLEGRVPMVLTCLLVEQGHTPQQALAKVTDFWLKTLPYLIRLPLTAGQRQFVLRWKK
jgi:hypothetical protein